MDRILTTTQYFIFVNFTSFAAILGGVLLWAGFVLAGLVSRRFEQAYGLATHWLLLLIAPAGAVIYLVMQSLASIQNKNMGPIELWTGYTLLLWSGLLCLWGAFKFYQLLKHLEQGRLLKS